MLFLIMLIERIAALVLLAIPLALGDAILLVAFSIFASRMEKRLLPPGQELLAMRGYSLVDVTLGWPRHIDVITSFIIVLIATPFVTVFGLIEIGIRACLKWRSPPDFLPPHHRTRPN